MKTYIAYKNRRQGFEDVLETVKTVEKIAASSIHFLKQEVSGLGVYTDEIEKILARLSAFYLKRDHFLLQKSPSRQKMLVVITGNKGLTGGLWHKVVNVFLENTKQYQSVIIIGSKGRDYLKEEGRDIKSFVDFSDIPKKDEIKHVTDYIFSKFRSKAVGQVSILYPRFTSLAEQQPVFAPFLPFEFKPAGPEGRQDGLPIFSPNKAKIFRRLLQKYIELFFYQFVVETKLSEFSARTVAMEHASAKTEELIKEFTLHYTKERRRAVTRKQLESFIVHKII